MKKFVLFFLLCPILSFGQASPVVPIWAAQQQVGLSNTAWQVYTLPDLSAIQLNPPWSTIDTGTSVPSFNYANYDTANLTPYTGWSLGAITSNGTTSTANILSGTWTIIQGATIIISGSSGCDGNYTAGTNGGTFVHFPSSCTSASGGKLMLGCGANLAQGAKPCGLIVMSAMTDASGIQNNAAYPFTQAYANSVCPAWVANATYGYFSCVTHGGNYYHMVSRPPTQGGQANGTCTDGVTFASVCLFQNDGSNALAQEATVTSGFNGGANAPPSSGYLQGGATYNVTTTNCLNHVCTAVDVAEGFPNYWETPIQKALINWCTGTDGTNPGFLPHYNAVIPSSQLIALECGAPQGVEWYFANEGYYENYLSENLTFTEGLFVNFAANNIWQAIHNEWVTLGSPSWGMLTPDGIYAGCPTDAACSLYSDLLASVSLVYPENSPGNYGVRQANLTTYATTGVVRGDWVGIFQRYPNTKYHIIEPFSVSCPQVNTYTPGNCNMSNQQQTGDFRQILPFATQFISSGTAVPIFILFEDDVACTYGSGFTVTVSGGAYPPCPNSAYVLPLSNGAQGIFANATVPSGIAGSFTIQGPTIPAPNPDNLYYGSNGIPTWGTTDATATLPTVGYNTAMANTPATGAVVNVLANSASDLQAKLTAATCGQQITLPAGSVYSGHFTYPALVCPANNYVWIVSSGLASLPAEGARYSTTYNGQTLTFPQFGPCYAGVTSLTGRPSFNCPLTPGTYTAQIVSPDGSPAWTFTAGTSGVRIVGIEFTRLPGTGFMLDPIHLGNLGNVDHVIFDRCWIHGVENTHATGSETENAMDIGAVSYIAVIDSYLNDFYCISSVGSCTESHVILGGTNTTNSTQEAGIKLVNNFFEGSSGLFLVGAPTNTTPGDIEVRLNTYFLPMQWNPSSPTYDGGVSGHGFIIKNNFEFKNGQRALIEGNQFQNVWGGFSQNGSSLLLTPKNQANGAVNQCPNCFVSNVTVRYNTFNTVGAPFQLVETFNGNGAFPAGFNNVSLHDNQADNINYSTCFGCGGTGVPAFQIWEQVGLSSSQTMKNFFINHNTVVQASTSGNPSAMLGLSGPKISTGNVSTGLTFTNNVGLAGTTGTANEIGGGITTNCSYNTTGGASTINACWELASIGGNCFVDNGSTSWLGTNTTSLLNLSAAFVNYNNGNAGNYALSINACKGQGNDLSDPGANLTALNAVLNGSAAPLPSPIPLLALSSMDDTPGLTTPGWQAACVGPPCAGGVQAPTSWNQTFTNASPSLDGNAMMMTETGTDYANVMFHYSIGANNAATSFTGTYSVYIPSLTPYQIFGMDMYQFIPGFRLMYGSQCAVDGTTAGFWSFFDSQPPPNGTWYVSSVPCPLTSAAWHTISMTVHRVPGDTSCPGGGPAVHYDSLTQDGTTYALNISHCSESYGGSNDTGMQFDVSSNSVGGVLAAYIDEMSYVAH